MHFCSPVSGHIFGDVNAKKMFTVKVDPPSSSGLNGTSSSDLNLTMYGMIIRDRYYRLPQRIAFKWIFMIFPTLASCINEQFSCTAVATAVDLLLQEERWCCSIKMLIMCKYIQSWQNVLVRQRSGHFLLLPCYIIDLKMHFCNKPQLEKWLFLWFYSSINSFYNFSESFQVLAIK